MPYINKIPKRKKTERTDTDIRKLRQSAYQSTAWRKLRLKYLKEHPICEECLKKGKVTPSEDIHHKISPFKGGKVDYNLLVDENNLMSLCKQCHSTIHLNQSGIKSQKQIIEELDNLLNNADNMSKDD